MLNRGKTVENLLNVRKSSYYNISIFAPLYIAVAPEGNQEITTITITNGKLYNQKPVEGSSWISFVSDNQRVTSDYDYC